MAANTEITLLDANITKLQKLKRDVTIMYDNGFAEKLDINKAGVQLTNSQTQQQNALNSITIVYYNLKALTVMPLSDTLVLTDSIAENLIVNDLASTQFEQYNARSDFKPLGLTKKLNKYNIQRYKLSRLPTLSSSTSYSKQAQRNTFTIFIKGPWFTTSFIGINLSVPIFSGFATKAKIAHSLLELEQTENNIANLKLSIDNEVLQAQLNFENEIATIN